MEQNATLFNPRAMFDFDTKDDLAIMSLVPIPQKHCQILKHLSTTMFPVKRFTSLKDPSGRTIAYFDADRDCHECDSWVLPAFHDTPIPGPVLITGLDAGGAAIPVIGNAGELWYGTLMGCGAYQWSRAQGIQRLPQSALDHWIMTIPRLKHLTYLLD